MLVGPTGLTRFCFGDPTKNKRDMNAYAAHPSQSLNAATLNLAWLKIFYDIALKNPTTFKLCAQIHDSILFQYRLGYEKHIQEVKNAMQFAVPVTDIYGITRNLVVPVAIKAGANRWSDIKKVKGL
jgi:hypothetical protein